MNTSFRLRAYFAGLASLACAAIAAAAAPARPNILFILADDLGLDGVSYTGSDKHRTPNIDKLAAGGLQFGICYASPLCGPTRCLLNTGRYAFRTGGITNGSWRPGGPGAKSADEQPIAKVMKAAGYATGMSGKWRQVGETPRDWGFDEYSTDPTAGGWYWQTTHEQNGRQITVPAGTYGPDVIHDFAVDFIRRHKDQPFYYYYSMHLVHTPTQHTPDSPKGAPDGEERYDDNIAYMDKKVGEIVAELVRLGLREKTLVIFTGDNGTARMYPSTVRGRMLSGHKGTMLEGGAREPFFANWPGVTPVGKVSQDIISFADVLPTCVELAGGKLPAGFKYDGVSFAPQLRGERGNPRQYAFVQLGAHWYVREQGYKMDETGALFDMSDAPFVEKPVAVAEDTAASKAARQRLSAVLAELNPAGGKTDRGGDEGGKQKAKKGKKRG